MQAFPAILILSSVAASSLFPAPSLPQEPEPPQRFVIPHLEVSPVTWHRLVVYRGPKSSAGKGEHREFVLEQGGRLEFHQRQEIQTMGSLTTIQTQNLDPLTLVTEFVGSSHQRPVLATGVQRLPSVAYFPDQTEQEVIRVLLLRDAMVVVNLEVSLTAPTSSEHARSMAEALGLWDALTGLVLEANIRKVCGPQPPSLEKIAEDWHEQWLEQARTELEAQLNMKVRSH